MKKLIIWMLMLAITSVSNAQNVDIPDANFKNALIEVGVDTDEDGEISYAEAEEISELYIFSMGISDLTGIEAFIGLELFSCDNNQLSSLDFTNNNALSSISCSENQLTTLDVSNNSNLKVLHCNNNQLPTLDVSNNTALENLNCGGNQLTSLDVSNNLALYWLECNANQLTSLDVSDCTSLERLYCYDNQLTTLDVSGCTNIKYLDCCSNQLTKLDVSNNNGLTLLNCGGNQLTILDVLSNIDLTDLNCASNQLTILDVLSNIDLTDLNCASNQLTRLDVSYNTVLWSLDCSNNQLTSLDVSNNLALDVFKCNENELTSLDVSKNIELGCLLCGENLLTNLDVFKNTALTSLDCSGNQLTSLDVTNNTALVELSCGGNQLTSLDVSKNTAIGAGCWSLLCLSHGLYLSHMPSLHEVCVWITPFPPHTITVDTTGSPNVFFTTDCRCLNDSIICIPDENFLHALIDDGVDTNGDSLISTAEAEAVTYINVICYCVNPYWCCSNPISDLTGLEAFINLDTLLIWGNNVDSIDLSLNIKLLYLDCANNQLTNLDVSNNTVLEDLNCQENQLTTLDVSGCSVLKSLDCVENQLTSLDISNNTALTELRIGSMPTLYEVCIWESFPAGVVVSTHDSPNVCFQTDCNGDCSKPSYITEESLHSGISLYPNPADDIINIEIENPNNATIEIYNVSGRLVFSKVLNSSVEKIDVSGLSKGMYFVKVRQENIVRIEKLNVY